MMGKKTFNVDFPWDGGLIGEGKGLGKTENLCETFPVHLHRAPDAVVSPLGVGPRGQYSVDQVE